MAVVLALLSLFVVFAAEKRQFLFVGTLVFHGLGVRNNCGVNSFNVLLSFFFFFLNTFFRFLLLLFFLLRSLQMTLFLYHCKVRDLSYRSKSAPQRCTLIRVYENVTFRPVQPAIYV